MNRRQGDPVMPSSAACRSQAGPGPVTVSVVRIGPGVACACWRPDGGRPDLFLLALTDTAGSGWLALADVVICPTQSTPEFARAVAVATLASTVTCTVVAVGIDGQGCLLRACDEQEVFVPSRNGSIADAVWLALFGYPTLVLTGAFEALACGDPRV